MVYPSCDLGHRKPNPSGCARPWRLCAAVAFAVDRRVEKLVAVMVAAVVSSGWRGAEIFNPARNPALNRAFPATHYFLILESRSRKSSPFQGCATPSLLPLSKAGTCPALLYADPARSPSGCDFCLAAPASRLGPVAVERKWRKHACAYEQASSALGVHPCDLPAKRRLEPAWCIETALGLDPLFRGDVTRRRWAGCLRRG